MRTLVIAAYPPELGDLDGRAVGIGLVAASAGTARAIVEARPERLILVGTAGALPGSSIEIGTIVVAANAQLVVRPGEYVPPVLDTMVPADAALAEDCARRLNAARVTVASPVGITSSDTEAARLAATAQVEHLETFAVLAAARGIVAATAVLAIANHVGRGARAEWQQHHAAAEMAAVTAVRRLLQGA